jgi:hypothetical protein
MRTLMIQKVHSPTLVGIGKPGLSEILLFKQGDQSLTQEVKTQSLTKDKRKQKEDRHCL